MQLPSMMDNITFKEYYIYRELRIINNKEIKLGLITNIEDKNVFFYLSNFYLPFF